MIELHLQRIGRWVGLGQVIVEIDHRSQRPRQYRSRCRRVQQARWRQRFWHSRFGGPLANRRRLGCSWVTTVAIGAFSVATIFSITFNGSGHSGHTIHHI
ncbi:MAG: hypothetical protein GC191_21040 [Azospirillum sp.]|nr:hypothetical protein [Azospirillum sp.]